MGQDKKRKRIVYTRSPSSEDEDSASSPPTSRRRQKSQRSYVESDTSDFEGLSKSSSSDSESLHRTSDEEESEEETEYSKPPKPVIVILPIGTSASKEIEARMESNSVSNEPEKPATFDDDASGAESFDGLETPKGGSPKSARKRTNGRKGITVSDDEEFEQNSSSGDDDEDEERESIQSDESDDSVVKRRKSRRGRLSMLSDKISRANKDQREKKRRRGDHSSDEDYQDTPSETDSEDDLEQELADLQDSSPGPNTTRKHLRARKEVNYQILPPPDDNFDFSFQNGNVTRRPAANRSREVRRLFPVKGPFGGSEVISVFGSGVLGKGRSGTGATGGVDSDSSDDDDGIVRPSNIITASNQQQGKSKAAALSDSDPLGINTNIDFSAVGGLDHYITQLKEMLMLPLMYPEVYKNFGITPPRGVLFHGPPGTGKTLMARALAASCSTETQQVTFFMRKGADCLSKWVGEAERQLRLLFEEAKNKQPSIIFFDEIDGLAPVRSSKQEQIHASIVSTLLALMDGMDNRGQVIVIGATNRPDSIDPALRRPGRFDREFYFPLPDEAARKKIIEIQTKMWQPPMDEKFVAHVAKLTKGYGGADIRALCTESALAAIQRSYPQIYQSPEKLQIDPNSIHVEPQDFLKSLEKIVPSSKRSASSDSEILPSNLEPLLGNILTEIKLKIDHIIPYKKPLSSLEDALLVPLKNRTLEDTQRQKHFEQSRIYRPRFLISGREGNGQHHLASAVLQYLEGFHVQNLDISTLISDSTRTPEAVIIQQLVEVKRHPPAVIYIPNVDQWFTFMSSTAKAALASVLRGMSASDKVLVLGTVDIPSAELDSEITDFFGGSSSSLYDVRAFTHDEVRSFFDPIRHYVNSQPSELSTERKKRKLKKLPLAAPAPVKGLSKEDIRARENKDMRLRNLIKVKLSTLMDLVKNRYKRFKKPIIDDEDLVHLFEPELQGGPHNYEKVGNMILETRTGKKYFNMDLDVIEERLWNGFYTEPKQYLKDIELIYRDMQTFGERERIIRASEMVTNVQVAVEEIGDAQFLEDCRELTERMKIQARQEIAEQKSNEPQNLDSEAVEGTISIESHNIDEGGQAQLQLSVDTENHEAAANAMEQVDDAIAGEAAPILPTATTIDEAMEVDNDISNNGSHPDETAGELNGKIDNERKNESKVEDNVTEINPLPASDKEADTSHILENGALSTGQATVVPDKPDSQDNAVEVTEAKDTEVMESSESSEASEPEDIIEIDLKLLDDFMERLVEKSLGRTVEELENLNSILVDVIWQNRNDYDRNKIIHLLDELLTNSIA